MLSTINQLANLLERIKSANDITSLKQETKVFLTNLHFNDRILAKEKLIIAGLSPENLHHSCFSHIGGLFEEAAEQLKQNLPSGHVILTMIEEHNHILSFLYDLEALNQTIQRENYIPAFELEILETIARYLLAAEPHHQREEQVLFPEIEQCGLFCPPQVIRSEHEELRAWEHALLELVQSVTQIDVEEFKSK